MRWLLLLVVAPLYGTVSINISNKDLFKLIYDKNYWVNKNTRSGNGSDFTETPIIRLQLPYILKKYDIKTVLDLGCGEMFWQKEMDLPFLQMYIGADIVPNIIEHNKRTISDKRYSFVLLDIVEQEIPCADAIVCRDVFQHLTDHDIKKAIDNIKKSGSRYLITSSFREKTKNIDHKTKSNPVQSKINGSERNLELAPFNFPPPVEYITEGFRGKSLGIWQISDLPDYSILTQPQEANLQKHLQLLEE